MRPYLCVEALNDDDDDDGDECEDTHEGELLQFRDVPEEAEGEDEDQSTRRNTHLKGGREGREEREELGEEKEEKKEVSKGKRETS